MFKTLRCFPTLLANDLLDKVTKNLDRILLPWLSGPFVTHGIICVVLSLCGKVGMPNHVECHLHAGLGLLKAL